MYAHQAAAADLAVAVELPSNGQVMTDQKMTPSIRLLCEVLSQRDWPSSSMTVLRLSCTPCGSQSAADTWYVLLDSAPALCAANLVRPGCQPSKAVSNRAVETYTVLQQLWSTQLSRAASQSCVCFVQCPKVSGMLGCPQAMIVSQQRVCVVICQVVHTVCAFAWPSAVLTACRSA